MVNKLSDADSHTRSVGTPAANHSQRNRQANQRLRQKAAVRTAGQETDEDPTAEERAIEATVEVLAPGQRIGHAALTEKVRLARKAARHE